MQAQISKEKSYKVGRLAELLHIKISKIRSYERSGMISEPERDSSGQRLYKEQDLQRLEFILRAQKLGFTLRQIKELLELRVDRYNNCEDVRQRIEEKSQEIEKKIQDLQGIQKALDRMADACKSRGPRGACPILDELNANKGGQL